ncbi:MAG: DUF3343 domain-containing protein [Acidobacteriota bacterium]|jgi:hypothetical protein|nr:DUF3343 domain-containing protein [Acidobacteriota bacterium]
MPEGNISFGVILLRTNSSALRAEKVLLKNGLTVKLIPTPREFSSDCGVSLRFLWSDAARVRALMVAENIDIDALHPMR